MNDFLIPSGALPWRFAAKEFGAGMDYQGLSMNTPFQPGLLARLNFKTDRVAVQSVGSLQRDTDLAQCARALVAVIAPPVLLLM